MFNGEIDREYDDAAAGRYEAEKAIRARCSDPTDPVERSVIAVEMYLGRDLAAFEVQHIAAILIECPEFAAADGPAVRDLVAELADAEVA